MPTPRPLAVVMAALFAAEPVLALAQQAQKPADKPAQEAPAQTGLTFAVGTSAVAIDVVVRDKKGHLVKDLTAADFELTEDGAKQQIESFTVVARGAEAEPETDRTAPAAPAAPAPAAAPAVPTQETPDSPAVLALVFDRMSPGGRDIAHKAALTYLAARQDGDFTGVFSIDLALHTVQNFTSDPDTHPHGHRHGGNPGRHQLRVLDGQGDQPADPRAALAGRRERPRWRRPPGPAPAPRARTRRPSRRAAPPPSATAARLEVGMMRSFEALERDQQGFATSNGLLAVVQGLQRVPGRKTIVFFSEGMAIPDRVLLQFQAVIAAANRANVAVYTMDAAGLRAHSQTEQTRAEIEAAATKRMQNMGREGSGEHDDEGRRAQRGPAAAQPAGRPRPARRPDRRLPRPRHERRARQLPPDRPGHALPLRPRLHAVERQLRRPLPQRLGEGQARRRRRALAARLLWRCGAGTSNPVLSYEAPAIAILDRPGPHAETFPLRGLALTFPSGGATVRVPVLVRFPGRVVKYTPVAGQKDVMAADLAVVVRVRNEYQQEVGRLSQHYQLSSPAAKVDAAKAGDILFYREADLPPGKYMLDAVAYDAGAVASSVRSFPLEVAAPGPNGADLSSLVVIDHVERVPAADRDPKNPLYFGDTLVYPNMGDPVRKAAKIMGFYFTAQAPPGARKALLEITKGGQVVNRLTLDLPAPDATGRVQHAGTLPLEVFSPGAYELHLSLLDGAQRLATRSTPLIVAE